jgi:hypothetical protein
VGFGSEALKQKLIEVVKEAKEKREKRKADFFTDKEENTVSLGRKIK